METTESVLVMKEKKNGLHIDQYGTKIWYLNGMWHREDGPAYESTTGHKVRILYDKTHREDGPAVEYSNGEKEWWWHGKEVSCSTQEQFERLVKLKAFW